MAEVRDWYTMEMRGASGEGVADIYIYDVIGGGFFDDDAVTAKSFVKEFNALVAKNPREIHLHINSPGGSVMDGTAIYNAIRAERERVVAFVEGWALSMASVVAVGAGKVVMAGNALMMIHNPQGMAAGDAGTMRKMARFLDKGKKTIVMAYVEKTGKGAEEIGGLMDETSWFTAEEAEDLGLVDEVMDGEEEELAAVAMAGFDGDLWRNYYGALGSGSVEEKSRAMAALAERRGVEGMGSKEKDGGKSAVSTGTAADGKSVEVTGASLEVTGDLSRPESPEEAEARRLAALASQIRAITPAGLEGIADACIAEGLTLKEARAKIVEAHGEALAVVGSGEPAEAGAGGDAEVEVTMSNVDDGAFLAGLMG